jgi:alpha,alpha-trehalose-phosphate synthase [UDP-forming]
MASGPEPAAGGRRSVANDFPMPSRSTTTISRPPDAGSLSPARQLPPRGHMDDAAASIRPMLEARTDAHRDVGDRLSQHVARPPAGGRPPRPIVLLSNREPYEHVRTETGIEVRQPPGGLVSALDPTVRCAHGVWVAWGSGSADRETTDAHDRLAVPPPPSKPSYVLRRVWLDDADVDGYYLGFANSVLWPLCHLLIHHLQFRDEEWARYQAVNRRFANAARQEIVRLEETPGAEPVVWVHDFHLALVAAMLRESTPGIFIHHFWHIPFPPSEILNLLPYGVVETLLRGLLGNDLLEFHTERHAINFLECASQLLPGTTVDLAALTVAYGGRTTAVGAYPISIDVDRFEKLAGSETGMARAAALRRQFASGGRQLGVSVDRVDYTKGIPERLRALDLLWEQSPELRGRFTMLVVAVPSRTELRPYQALEHESRDTVAAINERYGTPLWTPIVYLTESMPASELASIYRAADLCLVSSIQDGMNLVAKEFIACQVDERGVLVLSRFTGAAQEIDGAVLVNPFNVDGFAAGIRTALGMSNHERARRMGEMRERLRHATVFDWLDSLTARVNAMTGAAPLADAPPVHE